MKQEEKIKSFNGLELFVGDKVIVVFGRHLRNSEIEAIEPNVYNKLIKIKGLLYPISNNSVVKMPLPAVDEPKGEPAPKKKDNAQNHWV